MEDSFSRLAEAEWGMEWPWHIGKRISCRLSTRPASCASLFQVVSMRFDIRDEESIARAMAKSNVVINLLGRSGGALRWAGLGVG